MTNEHAELLALNKELIHVERLKALESLAVYSAMLHPQEVESDEEDEDYIAGLRGMEKLPLPARYVPAEHHRLLIEKLESLERGYVVERGKKVPFRRLMVFEPPGSGKSTYCSVLYPAWYLGRNPTHSLVQGSYNAKLAGRFGRRARNTFKSPDHFNVFGVGLAGDSKASDAWTTSEGGEYASFGMETGITGWRGNGAILDDPIKGRREADSKTERDNVWETYKADVRTRLKPNGWILYIATRWHEDDPAGRILPADWSGQSGWVTARDGERWYVLSLAAVIETAEEAKHDPLGREIGECLWPEWFSDGHFEQEKRSQGSRNWNALFQQKPRPDEGAILKKKFWRKWRGKEPPKCQFVMSVYDTAFEEGEEDDYSARTTLGIFWHEDRPSDLEKGAADRKPGARGVRGRWCAILLERWKERAAFPELRREAKKHFELYQPDVVMVEKKASGHSLIQELRRHGIPVRALKADKSKLARAHAGAVVLEQHCVWYVDRKWAEEVIDECARATFKKGDPGNDIPDTVVHALIYLRRTYHLQLADEEDEDDAMERENEDRKSNPRRFV